MSASKQKRVRQENREETIQKIAEEKAAEKRKKKLKKVRNIVIAVVVVLVIAAVIVINSNLFYTGIPAITINGTEFTAAECNYIYYTVVNNYLNEQSDYAEQLGVDVSQVLSMMGLNTNQPFDEQDCAMQAGYTWHDYFYEQMRVSLEEITALYDAAVLEGFELTQEDLDTIDLNINDMLSAGLLYGYNPKQYLAAQYGKGVTVDTVRKMMQMSMVAAKYEQQNQESYTFEDSELEAWYEENKNDYDIFTYRQVNFFADLKDIEEPTEEQTAQAMAEAKARAQKVVDGTTDEESFDKLCLENGILQYTLDNSKRVNASSSLEASYSEWMLDEARKPGDMFLAEDSQGYSAILFLEREDNNYTMRQVRHILVTAEKNEEGVVTEEAKAAALEEAEGYLDEWKNGEATEESFAALADEHTDDGGSKGTGGLYDMVVKHVYVQSFEDFAFAPGRKPGDTDIVYAEIPGDSGYAGYHIMYFIGEGPIYSHQIAENALRAEKYNAWREGIVGNAEYTFHTGKKFIG
ncbi:MAG: hypothetical protein E7444_07360 [Ruminococcaceae bacterium]|nr:hypothetical protein [Oscillospiraceae bacterium]